MKLKLSNLEKCVDINKRGCKDCLNYIAGRCFSLRDIDDTLTERKGKCAFYKSKKQALIEVEDNFNPDKDTMRPIPFGPWDVRLSRFATVVYAECCVCGHVVESKDLMMIGCPTCNLEASRLNK